ncbi:hypothetical protein Lal_00000828 [Lupinus albus]|uniref:Putative F-box domain, galactose oxidase/kelch, beta-propeller, kelch-type beta propeller n=1 Tax=Lupinus albus TaxID=3870 RepID=A0A6A5LID7_LUPAL|nr:putative F-box domain, galactose oxidase/kelch, beta-propeller, kelch-type beta propeller [Lupinus albus]KAF1859005.1 hypothetical protein Lal_00000828 [Lupinus albus]
MGGRTELAEDLVENILVRLSVKSLIRFKCVDRSWDILFKTPAFINNHMQIHRNQDSVLFSDIGFDRWLILNKNSKLVVDTRDLFPEINSEGLYDDKTYMLCHCSGIFGICVFFSKQFNRGENNDHKLFLWNPATREVKVVPPPPMPYGSHCYSLDFGFGVDPNSNDLKIVNLIVYDKNNHPPYAMLYNLITKSWTRITIDTIPVDAIGNCFYRQGFVANGVCYWIISKGWRNGNENILSFDFRNNQFHILKRPPTSMGYAYDFINEFNDSIAYVVHHSDPNYHFSLMVEIWILEEDRWTKKHTFPPFEYLQGLYAIWKGGAEFIGVAVGGATFDSFNSDSQTICDLGVSSMFLEVVHKYVESIASLSF